VLGVVACSVHTALMYSLPTLNVVAVAALSSH